MCKNNFPILGFFSSVAVGLKSCLSTCKSVEIDSARQREALLCTEQAASAPLTPRQKRKLLLHDSLGEDFAGDITMTMQFPVESFNGFQKELRELSAGKLKAEVIETKEKIMKII